MCTHCSSADITRYYAATRGNRGNDRRSSCTVRCTFNVLSSKPNRSSRYRFRHLSLLLCSYVSARTDHSSLNLVSNRRGGLPWTITSWVIHFSKAWNYSGRKVNQQSKIKVFKLKSSLYGAQLYGNNKYLFPLNFSRWLLETKSCRSRPYLWFAAFPNIQIMTFVM